MMAGNPFDKFDPQAGNPFDRFDVQDLDAIAKNVRKGEAGSLSRWDAFQVGAGKAVNDASLGIQQFKDKFPGVWAGLTRDYSSPALGAAEDVLRAKAGMPSVGQSLQTEIDRNKVRDEALMDRRAGTLGHAGMNLLMAAPTALVPGANTYTGSAAIGALLGALQPVASDESRALNAGLGTAGGVIGQLGGRAIGAATKGMKGLLEPFTDKGQNAIVQRTIGRFAGGPLNMQESPIPGVQRTLSEATLDPGIAQLERSISDPQAQAVLTMQRLNNNAARVNALRGVAGDEASLGRLIDARKVATEPVYAAAEAQGVDQGMADAMRPAIDNLMARPSIQKALAKVREINGEQSIAEVGSGSVKGLQMLKQALDDVIEKAPTSSVGGNELRALKQTRSDLISVMGDLSPKQREADALFRDMSKPVNAAQALQALLAKGGSATEDALGNPSLYPNSFNRLLQNSDALVKGATGRRGTLETVLPADQLGLVQAIGKDLSRTQAAANLGKGVGSNTAQNLASENLKRQLFGPLGLPQSFMESQIWPAVLRPVQFAMKSQEPNIQKKLAEVLINPNASMGLLPANNPVAELIARRLSGLLPAASVTTVNAAQK